MYDSTRSGPGNIWKDKNVSTELQEIQASPQAQAGAKDDLLAADERNLSNPAIHGLSASQSPPFFQRLNLKSECY